LIPPNLFILVGVVGLVIAWWRKGIGLTLATAAIGCLNLVPIPLISAFVIRSSEAIADTMPTLPTDSPPGAIIVLSADARCSDIAEHPDTVGPLTRARLAEAARQHWRLHLR
jgi:hypothetical protein